MGRLLCFVCAIAHQRPDWVHFSNSITSGASVDSLAMRKVGWLSCQFRSNLYLEGHRLWAAWLYVMQASD